MSKSNHSLNIAVDKWINKVLDVGSKANAKSVRNKGAQEVKKQVKRSVKELHPKKGRSPKVQRGKVYHPGNLDRSLILLNDLKVDNVTYVGPKLGRGSSPYKGASYDGFYGHMLERGTSKGIAASHWFEIGARNARTRAVSAMRLKAKDVMRKRAARLRIT